ncbi:uncharacterized protein LY79DRAFT_248822 [Colletotrichum navitas]|uniref:Uncharacterized protein n=1 Tax=Colletotrichum navitas TaxID=681940 RepID=A0AAD8QCN6_9PEZI|nr:uncharacterized protein LY79DRAFT_248822 [Colletotrichum navitas]KAK1598589.1 hypothetical protein LY79DRAFT_248822 [Colletotrichum navitas]
MSRVSQASSWLPVQRPTRTRVAGVGIGAKPVGHQQREGMVENGRSQGHMRTPRLSSRSTSAVWLREWSIRTNGKRKDGERMRAGPDWTGRSCPEPTSSLPTFRGIVSLLNCLRLNCMPVAGVLWSKVAHDMSKPAIIPILSSFIPCLNLVSTLPCFHCIPKLPRRMSAAKEIAWIPHASAAAIARAGIGRSRDMAHDSLKTRRQGPKPEDSSGMRVSPTQFAATFSGA